MIRKAVLLLLCFGLFLVLAPLFLASYLIDQRGVILPGHIFAKRESVVLKQNSWTHTLDLTVSYDSPDRASISFLAATVDPERFDKLRKGDPVQLHYLRREDMPNLPGARVLRDLHILPTVRLADQQAWSPLKLLGDPPTHSIVGVAAVVLVVLIFWRLARLPLFGWAVAFCVLCAMALDVIAEYPTPLPPPRLDLRVTSGTVTTLERIQWLYRDVHQQGFEAKQPIQIVGVQFVPAGRTEPVTAVDLIDEGSIPGLREHSNVSVEYENATPRTARIREARRNFARVNLQGIITEIVVIGVLLVVLLLGALLLRQGYRRLTQSASA